MDSMILWLLIPLLVVLLLWLGLERSLWPRKSTRDFWNLSNISVVKKIEGYFYGARPHLYLRPATWNWVTSGDTETADTYHGKVLTGEDATKLVSLKKDIELRDLEHVIPYPVARDIILRQPDRLAVMRCPCRAQKKDACEPRDVCLVVGEPYASFVVEHSPDKARFISLEEALDILQGEEERGHIHTAWFKDAMHHRFYVICNCCSCCCLGMKSYSRGAPRISHSGYIPVLDQEVCTGCGTCANICPFSALIIEDDLAFVDSRLCMGCGLCTSHCLTGAMALNLAPHKGTPLAIDHLLKEASLS